MKDLNSSQKQSTTLHDSQLLFHISTKEEESIFNLSFLAENTQANVSKE